MATGITKWYQKGKAHYYKGDMGDFESDTFKAVLLSSSYTPNQQTDETWADCSAYEVSGTGYTAGGLELANKTVTDSSLVITLDCDDFEWASSTITAKTCVIVHQAGASLASGDYLLCYISADANQSSSGTTFSIPLATTGLLSDTVS